MQKKKKVLEEATHWDSWSNSIPYITNYIFFSNWSYCLWNFLANQNQKRVVLHISLILQHKHFSKNLKGEKIAFHILTLFFILLFSNLLKCHYFPKSIFEVREKQIKNTSSLWCAIHRKKPHQEFLQRPQDLNMNVEKLRFSIMKKKKNPLEDPQEKVYRSNCRKWC